MRILDWLRPDPEQQMPPCCIFADPDKKQDKQAEDEA
jgi:hypothetical protein